MNKITVKKKMWNTLIAAVMDMHQRPSKTVLYKKCYFKKMTEIEIKKKSI